VSAVKPVLWITGAGGLVGRELLRTADQWAPAYRPVGLARADLDLADFPAVRAAFERDRPALVIHCAAMSRVPDCQRDPAAAVRINVEATACLAGLAANIPLFFLSTDQVFDGRAGPYNERDAANPLHVYGQTKVAAEQAVLRHPRHAVVRLSLIYGRSLEGNRAFNENLERAWERGETTPLFTDEFRCVLPLPVAARALGELAGRGASGLFHLGGAERLSRWQIGQLLAARQPRFRPLLVEASLRNHLGPPRPPDLSFDCAKIQRLLSFPLPKFSEWLAAHPEA